MRASRCRLLLGLVAGAGAAAGPPGQAPGLRLFSPHLGTDTFLLDDRGAVVHTWPSAYRPGLSVYLEAGGALLRAIDTGVSSRPGVGGGVQRVALDGSVLWEFRYASPSGLSHHEAVPMPNGNVLMIAWEVKTAAEAIAAGRDPALIGASGVLLPDHVVEVRPTGPTSGTIVWAWHVWDHLVQDFDPARANFGVVADHPELVDLNFPPTLAPADEWNHANGLDYDPVHDWVVISTPVQNEIWIVDHGTTTSEAAGHAGGRWGKGGDLLYRWGNPLAYRAGTAADQALFSPHDPRFIPAGRPGDGNVTVFNNRGAPTGSSVVELVLPLDPTGRFVLPAGGRYGPAAPVWSYAAAGFGSPIMSSAERLPSGDTLVCSAEQRWLFEVTPAGQVVWQATVGVSGSLPFHAHFVDRSLWASATSVSIGSGGAVRFDLIAGTGEAGHVYFLCGSASGTSPGIALPGHVLPLNPDGYLFALLASPNAPPFANNLATLDAAGRSVATFSLPAGALPASWIGARLDHAFVAVDAGGAVTKTSGAVPLVFGR